MNHFFQQVQNIFYRHKSLYTSTKLLTDEQNFCHQSDVIQVDLHVSVCVWVHKSVSVSLCECIWMPVLGWLCVCLCVLGQRAQIWFLVFSSAGHRGVQLCHPAGRPHRPSVCGHAAGRFYGGGGALDWTLPPEHCHGGHTEWGADRAGRSEQGRRKRHPATQTPNPAAEEARGCPAPHFGPPHPEASFSVLCSQCSSYMICFSCSVFMIF